MAIDVLTLALAKKMSGSSGGSAIQSDWNQNDETASDYIKNRPFYEETVETVLFKEHTAIFVADESYQLPPPVTPIDFNPDNPLFNGTTLRIVWDGVAYDCVTVDGLAGNGKPLGIPNLGNGEPFFFDFETFYVYEGGEHTYSVSIVEETVHKLDPKYIKDMYYTETVQKSQTREFVDHLIDAEFALLLFENRQTAKYVINGVQYTFEQDIPIPTGYLWSISSADGTSGTISIAGDNDVILATDATSITVNYEEEIIHKLDAKYLPEYDAVITVNEVDNNEVPTLVSGSNADIIAKLKHGDVPRVLVKHKVISPDGIVNIAVEHPLVHAEFENEQATEGVVLIMSNFSSNLVILPNNEVMLG